MKLPEQNKYFSHCIRNIHMQNPSNQTPVFFYREFRLLNTETFKITLCRAFLIMFFNIFLCKILFKFLVNSQKFTLKPVILIPVWCLNLQHC